MIRSLLLFCVLLSACSESTPDPVALEEPTPEPPPPVMCDCVLSSWIVAGRGRHLHLDIDCPEEFDHLDGRIEYTSAALRSDFDPTLLGPGAAPSLTRMTPGGRLYSPISEPQPRTEAEYDIEAKTAAWLQRDVAFSVPYVLLGANSNAAMRATLQRAGLDIPRRVLAGSGMFGEFPGINFSPGIEIPHDAWPAIGLPSGPVMPAEPLPDGWETLGIIAPNTPEPDAGT